MQIKGLFLQALNVFIVLGLRLNGVDNDKRDYSINRISIFICL